MYIVSGPFGHMTITGAWVLDGSGPGDTGVLCVGTRMELTDTRGLPTTMSPPHIMSSSWSETRWQLTGPKDKILYLTERVVEEEGRGKPHSWKIVVMLKCQKLRYFNYLAYPVCAQEARGWVMVIIVIHNNYYFVRHHTLVIIIGRTQ